MTLNQTRRALMAVADHESKTPLFGPCTDWRFNNGGAISTDSFYLNNGNSWTRYCYTRPMSKTYTEYIGKKIVIEFTNDKSIRVIGFGVAGTSNYNDGISGLTDRVNVESRIPAGTHKLKYTIGTDYVASTHPEWYLSLFFFAYDETDTSRVTLSDIKIYVEGE